MPLPTGMFLLFPLKEKSGKWLWYVFAVIVVLLAISNPASTLGGDTHIADTITFGDGTHIVGDIIPGNYYTSGPASDRLDCSWKRLKDTSGNPGSIIAENHENGPTTVVIYPSDGAFETSGCSRWSKMG